MHRPGLAECPSPRLGRSGEDVQSRRCVAGAVSAWAAVLGGDSQVRERERVSHISVGEKPIQLPGGAQWAEAPLPGQRRRGKFGSFRPGGAGPACRAAAVGGRGQAVSDRQSGPRSERDFSQRQRKQRRRRGGSVCRAQHARTIGRGGASRPAKRRPGKAANQRAKTGPFLDPERRANRRMVRSWLAIVTSDVPAATRWPWRGLNGVAIEQHFAALVSAYFIGAAFAVAER